MYEMNYDRAVLALWDEKLKEDLHEAYYDFIPEMRKFLINPKLILQGPPKNRGPMLFDILSKWILKLKEPNQVELTVFILKHSKLLTDRITKILDKDEIIVQIKRRRLLG